LIELFDPLYVPDENNGILEDSNGFELYPELFSRTHLFAVDAFIAAIEHPLCVIMEKTFNAHFLLRF
jgi:hypothetical protein